MCLSVSIIYHDTTEKFEEKVFRGFSRILKFKYYYLPKISNFLLDYGKLINVLSNKKTRNHVNFVRNNASKNM